VTSFYSIGEPIPYSPGRIKNNTVFTVGRGGLYGRSGRFAIPHEGRKRVLGVMAAILTAMHMKTAGNLFGTPSGSPDIDKLIAASVQWAERIMRKIDNVFT
jgi:hypothetical protein